MSPTRGGRRNRMLATASLAAKVGVGFVRKKEARDNAGQIIFRACFESLFHHCVYNADPHPGNYLFTEDGDVTFLDFGCVRRFPMAMIDTWKREAHALLSGDRTSFEREFQALGFVPNPRRFDWEHQWNALRHVYAPFLSERPFRFTAAYVREMNEHLLFKNPNLLRTAMPREWLMLNRLQWGLYAILAQLEASGPWPELWRAAIGSPTAPAAVFELP